MSRFLNIVANGNMQTLSQMTAGLPRESSQIECDDGFKFSVIAGPGAYSIPNPGFDEEYSGPYTHVEVGFPTAVPVPWSEWEEYADDPIYPTGTVYPRVPVDMVRKLINRHGGEV